jgi:hypothetical protein
LPRDRPIGYAFHPFRWEDGVKTILLAAFLGILLSLPAFGYDCTTYLDSQAAASQTTTFCWLSGAICYQCYDVNTGDNCSSNWSACDPYRRRPQNPDPSVWMPLQVRPGRGSSCLQPPVLRHDRTLHLAPGVIL